MVVFREIRETGRWRETAKRIEQHSKRIARDVIESEVRLAQGIAVSRTPVYDGGGAVLPEPDPTGRKGPGYTGDWVDTVIKTLADPTVGYGAAMPTDDPVPGRLRAAIERPVRPIETEKGVVIGFASRSELDADTAYQARLLLRYHHVRPEERRRRFDASRGKRRPSRPQLLWWNWDEGQWVSASLVGFSSGDSAPLTSRFGEVYGSPIGNWRGPLPGGTGYWADMEFGTERAQLDASLIPGPGENMVAIYLDREFVAAAPMESDEGLFVRPRQFLARAADYLADRLKGGALATLFKAALRGAAKGG